MRLSFKYSVPLALCFFAIILGIWGYILKNRMAMAQIEKVSKEALSERVAVLQSAVERYIAQNHPGLAVEQLRMISQSRQISEAVLVDGNGVIIMAGSDDIEGRQLDILFAAEDETNRNYYLNAFRSTISTGRDLMEISPDGDYSVCIVPVQYTRQTQAGGKGVLFVRGKLALWKAIARRDVFNEITQFCLILFFLSLLLGFYLNLRITGPVKKLVTTMQKVEQGALSSRTNLKGNNEIAYLGRTFDHIIAEREKYEQELRESSQNYREIFNATTAAIILIDMANKTILDVNRSMLEMFDYSAEEAIGIKLPDLIKIGTLQERNGILKELDDVIEFGQRTLESRCMKKNGSLFWAEITLKPVTIGAQSRILAIIYNIEARKQAEYRRDAFAAIVEATPDVACIKDLNLRVIAANSAFLASAGRKNMLEVIGQTDIEIFGPLAGEKITRGYVEDEIAAQKLAPGEAIVREEEMILPDGHHRTILTRKFPVFNSAGRLIATASIASDVTEEKRTRRELLKYRTQLEKLVEDRTLELQKVNEELENEIEQRQRTEQALVENEKYLEMLIRNIPTGVLVFEAETRYIIKCNAQIAEILQLRMEDIVSQTNKTGEWQLYDEDMHPLEIEDYPSNRVFATGKPVRNMVVGIHTPKMKELTWIMCTAIPVFDQEGNISQAISTMTDITTRKRAEQELAKLNKELDRRNKEMKELLYVASHDLRAPLVSINGFSRELAYNCEKLKEVLAGENLSKEAAEKIRKIEQTGISESLAYITSGAAKMDSLLQGMLHISRIGTSPLNIHKLDVRNLIEEAVKAMQYQIKEHGIEIVIDDLPPCSGDHNQVNQIFSNLIGNAIKYSDPLRKGRIEIQGKIAGDKSIYSIKDNGIGIHENDRDKIFEIFKRLDPHSTDGDGLGLTIVRRILDRHKGEIWLESEPGKGSTFYVSLPRT